MLTAVKLAFCFCIVFGVFEQTVSWTIDLPQVRKYFFEKSLEDRVKDDLKIKEKVIYDNIDTHSLHFDYDKYREHYADEYKYNGYMEQKVQESVRNGSVYLEGLRRSVERYTRGLEACRQINVTANVIQFRPNLTTALSDPNFTLNNSNLSLANFSNFNLPTNFTLYLPANITYISSISANFTRFMAMSGNYTMFNISDGFRDCMRAELASEHVRRLAQLAVWAASELQDKLYADKYDKEGPEHDDALVLRLAWFLDRLAHLTGYDPRPELPPPQETDPTTPESPMLSLVPILISNEDLRLLTSCMAGGGAPAPARCALPARPAAAPNPDSYMSRGYPAPSTFAPDSKLSAAENQEYIYSEQEFTDDDMPLSLPQRPAKTKRKRSVQGDPLQNFIQYYAKYKVWTGSNQNEEKDSSELSNSQMTQNVDPNSNYVRTKRFIAKKKFKHIKPEFHIPDLGSIVKHKLEVHVKKGEKEPLKKIIEKLHVKHPKTEFKLLKFKKSKRSIKYSNKVQPRVPVDPQGDISYYVKNKRGRNYSYNAAQAALVRGGLEQVFQTGSAELVRRYGSNYNPANGMQLASGYAESYADV